ncbi:hypothetical protein C5750_07170 [Phyllobacterium myrsinacearum]|uniref:Uncharacterized protein n=1 Tax=Phyllobacterium myrsinacearum TaxID=28101 RepID=A0A2S9JPH2_9HYPH|nr:hypothetical protein C5750_07170 [Phyllobacterium myrsinacearum]
MAIRRKAFVGWPLVTKQIYRSSKGRNIIGSAGDIPFKGPPQRQASRIAFGERRATGTADPVLQSLHADLKVVVIVHIAGVLELDLSAVENVEQILRRGVMDEPGFRRDGRTAFEGIRHEDAENSDNGRIPIFHRHVPWI